LNIHKKLSNQQRQRCS